MSNRASRVVENCSSIELQISHEIGLAQLEQQANPRGNFGGNRSSTNCMHQAFMRVDTVYSVDAESEFEKYRIVQDRLFESDFDRIIKQIESEHKSDKEGE